MIYILPQFCDFRPLSDNEIHNLHCFLFQLLPKELIDYVHIDEGVAGNIYVPAGSELQKLSHSPPASSQCNYFIHSQ